jgi:flagellum-specific peptidoglycan hydrolase FlgJ
MALSKQQEDNLKRAAIGSYALAKELDLPIEFCRLQLSQGVFESAWFSKQSGDNNYFGITWVKGDTRPYRWVDTYEEIPFSHLKLFNPEEAATATEMNGSPLQTPWTGNKKIRMKRRFVSFPSVKDCFAAHLNLLTRGSAYRVAMDKYKQHKDIYVFITDISKIYATDKSYTTKIINMFNSREIKDAVAYAIANYPGNNEE